MTAMMLALFFSDALNSPGMKNYRTPEEQEIGGSAEPHIEARPQPYPWRPRVGNWDKNSADCPIFFQKDIKGFGILRIGPSCNEDGLPHAL